MIKKIIAVMLMVAACFYTHGQGFVYDQQIGNLNPPGGYADFTSNIVGQSFVPNLSSVGFIRLYLGDSTPNGGGATMFVNLWSGSIGSGTLLASTDPISTSIGFVGTTTFFFSAPITVASGMTYYFQPVVQSGDAMDAGLVPGSLYLNGEAFYGGTFHNANLWFQEGVVVPEPSTTLLTLLGVVGLYLYRSKRQ